MVIWGRVYCRTLQELDVQRPQPGPSHPGQQPQEASKCRRHGRPPWPPMGHGPLLISNSSPYRSKQIPLKIMGFLSHGGTPNSHPFLDGISLAETIQRAWGTPMTSWKPPLIRKRYGLTSSGPEIGCGSSLDPEVKQPCRSLTSSSSNQAWKIWNCIIHLKASHFGHGVTQFRPQKLIEMVRPIMSKWRFPEIEVPLVIIHF